MPSTAQLKVAVDELEALTSVHAGNENPAGLWLRFALAAEQARGSSTSANDSVTGYMLRSAVALEALAGTSGAEENVSYEGLLKRIVDALEVKAGAVTTGSLEGRFVVAATNAVFEAVRNLLLHSNDYTQTAWTKVDTTISAGVAEPGGTTIALLTEGSLGTALVRQPVTTGATPSLVGSTVVKRGNHDWLRMIVRSTTNTARSVYLYFNMATGVAGTGAANHVSITNVVSSVTALGDGFYRIMIGGTWTDAADGSSFELVTISATADVNGVRIANGTRYQGMSQLEIGTALTAYQARGAS